jgi:hypothetical protein
MPRSTALLLLLAGVPATAVAQDPAPAGAWPVDAAEAAGYPYNVQYGGWPPGGYEARVGRPYYWSVPGGTVPLSSYGSASYGSAGAGDGAYGAPGRSGCGCNGGQAGATGYGGPVGYGAPGYGSTGFAGYGGGAAAVPQAGPAGDPYTYHFGPGFYRSNEFGHYRFPYYSYRRPWYDVGHPVRVRDTNLPW